MNDQMNFGYTAKYAEVAFEMPGYYIWDSSVIFSDGKYHLFCSRWKEEYGFGWNWLFNSEIIRAVSDKPEGPYEFANVVLPRRGRQYFDGMNTHNACIREWMGKYYLYYMGTTYGGDIPYANGVSASNEYGLEVWNKKRIGVAVADRIDGEFVRREKPLIEPRGCESWDCTVTTNPAVTIMPDGKTYMIYKSRRAVGQPLQLGIAVSDRPDGEFSRFSDSPILDFGDPDKHIEDPFLWYDKFSKRFCMIAKDDPKNASSGITGEWGDGFFAYSENGADFVIPDSPVVYSRHIKLRDGREKTFCNLERPSVLFDSSGKPTHIFCASGNGSAPYDFSGRTFVICMTLEAKGE